MSADLKRLLNRNAKLTAQAQAYDRRLAQSFESAGADAAAWLSSRHPGHAVLDEEQAAGWLRDAEDRALMAQQSQARRG